MGKNMKILAMGIISLGALQVSAGFSLIHEFAGGDDDGQKPRYSTPIENAGILYSMTYEGGDSNLGTIFKVGTDGAGFTLLHDFAGGAGDGSYPSGSLILDGSALYGMTYRGGDSDLGTIFKIGTDGTGFTLLHDFASGADDGAGPFGSLILDSSTLYGMTYHGGDSNLGTIFKIGTDGSGFTLLHDFAGGGSDGSYPLASLTPDDSTLYGMTNCGGDSDSGVIFKINSDGTDYSLLHEFAGGADDGRRPEGSLTLDASILYGMTFYGGDANVGTIFKIGTDGTGYSLLHEFAGGGSDGIYPTASLVLDGSSFYGMTLQGGDSDRGTIFKIASDDAGFSLLHEFAGAGTDGSHPLGSLIISGGKCYGMTSQGGDSNLGSVFSASLIVPNQDFNGDGKSDVIAENSSFPQRGYMYLMNGSIPASSGGVYRKTNTNWTTASFADFNGDGKSDMLWTESETNEALIYIMDGLTITKMGAILGAGADWLVDQVADFNGDGKADILLKEASGGDSCYIFIMDGITVSSVGRIPCGANWLTKSSGDFNGDGKADILWEIGGKIGYMYLMDGTTVSSQGQVYSNSSKEWSTDKFADFNGDGKSDILWRYDGSSTIAGYIYLMNGLSLLSSGYTYSTGNMTWIVIQTGDLNGDGKADLLLQNSANGQGVGYIMNGISASSWGLVYRLRPGNKWQVKKLLDFSGDGKADILWHNSMTKKALDYIMNGLLVTTTGTIFPEGTKTVIEPPLSNP